LIVDEKIALANDATNVEYASIADIASLMILAIVLERIVAPTFSGKTSCAGVMDRLDQETQQHILQRLVAMEGTVFLLPMPTIGPVEQFGWSQLSLGVVIDRYGFC
jgi:hypothetical protein